MPLPEPLAPLVTRPDRAGVFCDFDGTLAEIVVDPAAARPVEGAVEALTEAAQRFARVGVISGRPAAFLERHFGGRGITLSGLYGLEVMTDGGIVADAEADRWRAVIAATADAAQDAGLVVERKGLTVTLHFRADPDREAETRSWAEAEAARTGLRVQVARMSYELRPPVARDKGAVLSEQAQGLEAVCFVGDDRGDLDAFDALDRLAAEGVTTVRVGVRNPEAPAELLERSDLLLDGPAAVVATIGALARG